MRLTISLIFSALLAGCAHESGGANGAAFQAPTAAEDAELSFGPGDTFEVHVFGEADLSGTFRVDTAGTIDYPLIGQLKVAGLEPHATAKMIQDRLSEKFLKHPQVSVLVKDQSAKRIIVIGQVTKPGTFPFSANMNVVEAITLAGGFTPIAAKNDTTITRVDGGQKTSLKAPVADIGEGKVKNVRLHPGDMISVPERIF